MIGIAAGTVLLPEMARRITAGDEAGARHSQNRAVEMTLLLAVPCMVAFLIVPELIMRALFGRGAFTAANAQAAGATLAAYAHRAAAVRTDAQRDGRRSCRAATPSRRSRRCSSRSRSTSR